MECDEIQQQRHLVRDLFRRKCVGCVGVAADGQEGDGCEVLRERTSGKRHRCVCQGGGLVWLLLLLLLLLTYFIVKL